MKSPICKRCGSSNVIVDRSTQQIECVRCGTIERPRLPPQEAIRNAIVGSRIWPVLGGLCALIVVLYALFDLTMGTYSLFWPTVPGTVVEHQLKKQPAQRSGYNYTPRLLVAYTVNGQSFTAGRLRCHGFDPRFIFQDTALAWFASYPIGQNLPVAVNPLAPGESCLIAGTPHWALDLGAVLGVGWWIRIGQREARQRAAQKETRSHRQRVRDENTQRWNGILLLPPALLLTVISYNPLAWQVYAGMVAGAGIFGLSILADAIYRSLFKRGWTHDPRYGDQPPFVLFFFIIGWLVFIIALATPTHPLRDAVLAAISCQFTLGVVRLLTSGVGERGRRR
jgi:hypothetical protein